MGYHLVQFVADLVPAMLCMLASGDTTAQGIETVHPGQDCSEQEGEPDIVRSQRLGQNGRQCKHKMNLQYEALLLEHPATTIRH